MHKHTVFLFVILLLIAANVYGQAIDSLQITHIARTISQETDMFLTESVGESKELCTFVRTIHHTTTSMNLRLILLYCLLMQFLIPTYGYGKGYFTATRLSPTTYGFTPYYYNKDHLGNIREVVDAGGNLQQRTNYYPFGETHGDCPSVRDRNVQQKQIDQLCRRYHLSQDQRQELHRAIHGEGYGYNEVEEVIKELFGK